MRIFDLALCLFCGECGVCGRMQLALLPTWRSAFWSGVRERLHVNGA
jgi:hypothetical protein